MVRVKENERKRKEAKAKGVTSVLKRQVERDSLYQCNSKSVLLRDYRQNFIVWEK